MPTLMELQDIDIEVLNEPAPWTLPEPASASKPIAGIPVFGEMLLESNSLQKRRRSLATCISFLVQCLLLGVLLAVPLMFTEDLPKAQLLTFLVAPSAPPPPPPSAAAPAARVVRPVQSEVLESGGLRAPSTIPQTVQMLREEDAPPPLSDGAGGVIGGVPGGIPGGQLGGVIGGIVNASTSVSAIPKLAVPTALRRVRISQGVTRGYLVTKVDPHYPPLAKQARIQGEVVLQAIISKAGAVANLQVISGHPFLAPAAIDAVRQWQYRPFLLNGQAIEVETTVTVTFRLTS